MLRNIGRKWLNYETITYLICGVMTTGVDWVTFWILNTCCLMDYRLATALSWLAAVLFAYVANKLIVFRNFRIQPAYLWKEWWSFFAARAFSGILVMILMVVMVDGIGLGNLYCGTWSVGLYLAKAVASAVNLLVNYVFSKRWIFKRS